MSTVSMEPSSATMHDASTTHDAAVTHDATATPGWLGGSWRQLSEQVGRALCALRAINDLRHRRQILFPGHDSQGKGRAAITTGEAEELVRLPAYDQKVLPRPGKSGSIPAQQVAVLVSHACHADGSPHEDCHSLPTVLLFYSAEMHLAAMMPVVQLLRRRGINVAVAEYIGYGQSSGEPSERGCYATAEAAFEYLLDRPDIDPTRIVLMGCGLGATVAADLAARHEVAALACLSPFTSMLDLLRWRLPQRTVDVLVRQKFDTAERIKQVRCPIALVHAADDPIIPAEMSERLFICTRSVCRRIVLEEGKLHGAELLSEERAVLDPLTQFIHEARPRLATAPQRRAAIVTTRPLAIRPPARPTDDRDTPPAYSSETPAGWRLPSPSRTVPVQYPKPASRAC